MTNLVFIRLWVPGGHLRRRWHLLLTIGSAIHVAGCLDKIPAAAPIELRATEPPREELCPACRAHLDVLRARAETRDLRPYVGEIGIVAMVDVDEIGEGA